MGFWDSIDETIEGILYIGLFILILMTLPFTVPLRLVYRAWKSLGGSNEG